MTDMNWEAWAIDMCSLLDRIELLHDDGEAVYELCQGRFDMAREHGLEVQMLGPTSGRDQ
jgi:hypothetical protein